MNAPVISATGLNKSWVERRAKAVSRGVGMAAPVIAARAENSEIWDIEGNRYIDFGGGIAVVNTGHRHPLVMKRVYEQLEKFTHTCGTVMPYAPLIELCEKINAVAPISGEKKSALVTTGAEAVENAVKFARCYTGRSDVIAFQGSFHGRTNLTMALTGKVNPYKIKFGPFPAGIWHVPFPVAHLGVSVDDTMRAIDTLFKCDVESSNVAAIIIEPVQGEGGFYVAPKELMARLRKLCDEHGIVLIADEI
ncbi:MAG: aminotransferase class III-fold pyridoxal phosphate-dependent enzyme, partial [Rhizobiales bacterium]|nr:aminotransferase class III-fold pyridoxal phosphate-dependent enzyme [Hyphomicrobiales bacterium]